MGVKHLHSFIPSLRCCCLPKFDGHWVTTASHVPLTMCAMLWAKGLIAGSSASKVENLSTGRSNGFRQVFPKPWRVFVLSAGGEASFQLRSGVLCRQRRPLQTFMTKAACLVSDDWQLKHGTRDHRRPANHISEDHMAHFGCSTPGLLRGVQLLAFWESLMK